MLTARSRDLSEVFASSLKVTIEGIGTMETAFSSAESLAVHVGDVHVCLTGKTIVVQDPSYAPWQMVSLDRKARKLVVRSV